MAEGQSRYGIIDELNEKKINERKQIAGIEDWLAQETNRVNDLIADAEGEIAATDATYEMQYETAKKQLEMKISALISKNERDIENIKAKITELDDTHEGNYHSWKDQKKKYIVAIKRDLDNATKNKGREIAAKKIIIEEYDAGIESIKAISRESDKT